MTNSILDYHSEFSKEEQLICKTLAKEISNNLPKAESKIWHAHPVWFLDANPIVGYSKQKAGIRLMYWSGQDFGEKDLNVFGKKFKDASIILNSADEIETSKLKLWCDKATEIQWDYKNIVKRKGRLIRLK